MTQAPNFKAEKPENQSFYNQVNSLSVGDELKYLGDHESIIGFTSTHILTSKQKLTVYEFEGYIYHGFLSVEKSKNKIDLNCKYNKKAR